MAQEQAVRQEPKEAVEYVAGYRVLKNGLIWIRHYDGRQETLTQDECHRRRMVVNLAYKPPAYTSKQVRNALLYGFSRRCITAPHWNGMPTEDFYAFVDDVLSRMTGGEPK